MNLSTDLQIFTNKNILITGGTGFIGSGLVRLLQPVTCELHVLVRKTSNLWRLKPVLDFINIHEVEFSGQQPLTEQLPGLKPDFIFHFAEPSNGQLKNIDDFIRIQAESANMVKNVLEFAREVGNVKKIIHACSSTIYGRDSQEKVKESDCHVPHSWRGLAKLTGYHICRLYVKKYNLPVNIARIFRAYGPYEESNRLIHKALDCHRQNKKIDLVNDGVKRDYIFLDDLLQGVIKMCATNIEPGEEFNIASGQSYSAHEIVGFLEEILTTEHLSSGFNHPITDIDKDAREADISKARRVLNWVPETDIRTGLRLVTSWYQDKSTD